MRKILAVAIIVSALVSCNNTDTNTQTNESDSTTIIKSDSAMNSLTDAQKAEGWQLLFDGNSTSGWHTYGNKPVGSAWKVSNGVLTLDTSSKKDGKVVGGGDLVTDEEFENFHLKLEWMIAKNGNSGIMFHVVEDTAKYKHPYETGPEMQVLDNAGHPDGKNITHRAGDLYDLISASKETVKPAGEWNLAEIKCENRKLDLYLNGENIVSTMMDDEKWKNMVAKSKFKERPDFATYKKGKICLQDHDNMVSFRNIMIRRL